MKRVFYDRHESRVYVLIEETCRQVLADPRLIDTARAHMEKFMADDPHQRPYYLTWNQMQDRKPEQIVAALLEDTPEGDILRWTMPSFGGIPVEDRMRIIEGLLRSSSKK